MRVAALLLLIGCGRVDFDVPTDGMGVGGYLTPVEVQRGFNFNSSGASSITITLPNPSAEGDLIIIGSASFYDTVSITDDAGNAYVSAGLEAQNTISDISEIWYAKASNAGATVVTIVYSDVNVVVAWALEYANMDLVDPLAAGAMADVDNALATATSPDVSTTIPGSVVFAVGPTEGEIVALDSPTPFSGLGIADGDVAAVLIAATVGTYTASWDVSPPGAWSLSSAVFVPARR